MDKDFIFLAVVIVLLIILILIGFSFIKANRDSDLDLWDKSKVALAVLGVVTIAFFLFVWVDSTYNLIPGNDNKTNVVEKDSITKSLEMKINELEIQLREMKSERTK